MRYAHYWRHCQPPGMLLPSQLPRREVVPDQGAPWRRIAAAILEDVVGIVRGRACDAATYAEAVRWLWDDRDQTITGVTQIAAVLGIDLDSMRARLDVPHRARWIARAEILLEADRRIPQRAWKRPELAHARHAFCVGELSAASFRAVVDRWLRHHARRRPVTAATASSTERTT